MAHQRLTLSILCLVALIPVGCSQNNTAYRSTGNGEPSAAQTSSTNTPGYAPTFATNGTADNAGLIAIGHAHRTSQGRYVSTLNLFGEMSGSPDRLPNDTVTNLTQVSFTREGADFDVDIDASGQWLVYASTRHRPTADLYVKRVDGSTVTQLTTDPADDTMPSFSPDGKMVAFCSDRSGTWDIYVQPLDGGQPIQITADAAQNLHPSWSPDGKQIIFSSLGQASGQWEMVVVDFANTAKRKVIGYGLFPRFSPDGKKIVFQKARYRGTRWFSVWTLDYVNGEGIHPTEIAASTNAAVITPSWSPDGTQLVFATVIEPNKNANDPAAHPEAADLWTVNLDGTGRTRLTTDNFVNLQPAWGKDGRIFFISNRSGSDNIWAMRPGPDYGSVNLVSTPGYPAAQASVPNE